MLDISLRQYWVRFEHAYRLCIQFIQPGYQVVSWMVHWILCCNIMIVCTMNLCRPHLYTTVVCFLYCTGLLCRWISPTWSLPTASCPPEDVKINQANSICILGSTACGSACTNQSPKQSRREQLPRCWYENTCTCTHTHAYTTNMRCRFVIPVFPGADTELQAFIHVTACIPWLP